MPKTHRYRDVAAHESRRLTSQGALSDHVTPFLHHRRIRRLTGSHPERPAPGTSTTLKRRRTRGAALIATSATLTLAFASCATGPREDTSFLGASEIELCSPNPDGAETQLGISTLDNGGHAEPALINHVELRNAHGIELVDAYVMPIDEWSSLMMNGVRDPEDPAWATGAKMGDEPADPITGSSEKGLMLVLRTPKSGGSFGHVRVHFERGGSSFYADGVFSVSVPPVGVPCF